MNDLCAPSSKSIFASQYEVRLLTIATAVLSKVTVLEGALKWAMGVLLVCTTVPGWFSVSFVLGNGESDFE